MAPLIILYGSEMFPILNRNKNVYFKLYFQIVKNIA